MELIFLASKSFIPTSSMFHTPLYPYDTELTNQARTTIFPPCLRDYYIAATPYLLNQDDSPLRSNTEYSINQQPISPTPAVHGGKIVPRGSRLSTMSLGFEAPDHSQFLCAWLVGEG